MASDEIQGEMANLARLLGSNPDELEGEERAFRQAVEAEAEARQTAVEDYSERLAGLDPEEASSLVRDETGDASLGQRVAQRVWEKRLTTLDEDSFLREAVLVEDELSPMHVHYIDKVVAVDIERERRGLAMGQPLVDLSKAGVDRKPEWDDETWHFMAAESLRWRLNERVASFNATDTEIRESRRAEAEAARALRRYEAARG
jgi:hypothetical protein